MLLKYHSGRFLGFRVAYNVLITKHQIARRWRATCKPYVRGYVPNYHRQGVLRRGCGPAHGRVRSRSPGTGPGRSEEHTSELQSQSNLACRLLLEKKYLY